MSLQVMSALRKMSREVDWGNLDILVIDMPPGTGDAQITTTQMLQLSGKINENIPYDSLMPLCYQLCISLHDYR